MTFQRVAVAALMAVVTLWSAVDTDAGQSRRAMRRARRCGYGYGCGYNYQCCTPQCGACGPQCAVCIPCTSDPCAGWLCPLTLVGQMGPYCIWTAWHCSAHYTAQMNHTCNLITGCNDPPQGRCAYTGEMNPLTADLHRGRHYHHTIGDTVKGYQFAADPNRYITVVNDVPDLQPGPGATVTLLGTNPRFVRIIRAGGRPAVVQLLDIKVQKANYPDTVLHLGFEVDPVNPAPPNPNPSRRLHPIREPGIYEVDVEVDDGMGNTVTETYDVIVRQ